MVASKEPRLAFLSAKKVRRDGTVAGLRSHAGRSILVLAPPRLPEWARPAPAVQRVRERARQWNAAGRQRLGETLAKPLAATQALAPRLPPAARPYVERADAWLRKGAARVQARAGMAANPMA